MAAKRAAAIWRSRDAPRPRGEPASAGGAAGILACVGREALLLCQMHERSGQRDGILCLFKHHIHGGVFVCGSMSIRLRDPK